MLRFSLIHDCIRVAPLMVASFFLVHCGGTVAVDGAGGGSAGTSTVGSTSGSASSSGSTSSSSGAPGTLCVAPKAPSITVFTQATEQGTWSDPVSGLSGMLSLDPASAGMLAVTPAYTHLWYTQVQDVYGQFLGDPTFGVWFSGCVDASAFSGVSFEVWPIGAPAGSGAVLVVETASTTPPPRGTCTSNTCVPPTAKTNYSQFGTQNPYTVYWTELMGAQPAEDGAAVAQEIIGLRFIIDEWVGPPPGPAQIEVEASNLTFVH